LNATKYKLIVSDLDGTLLNGKSALTERTVSAIRRFRQAGGLFTIATGRAEDSARVFAARAGIDIPIISYNGGKIINLADGKVIFETFLDGDLAIRAFRSLRSNKKDVVAYVDNYRYVEDYSPVIDRYVARIRNSVNIVDDIARIAVAAHRSVDATKIADHRSADAAKAAAPNRVFKKLLILDPKQEDELLLRIIQPIFGDALNFEKSSPEYYEIMPPNTSKGRALSILADCLGVGIGQTAAIGDHINDVSMLKAAGLGVAVANAVPEALAAASRITASNDDDGAAQFIESLI